MNRVSFFITTALACGILFGGCTVKKPVTQVIGSDPVEIFKSRRSGGGSSGMEQIGDKTYLLVYDVKRSRAGYRMGLLRIAGEKMEIKPVAVEQWGAGGIGNDLESICRIPGKPNEFLIGESGDWQGRPGSIFHVKVDTALLKAEVLGTVKIPLLHNNDFGKTGDQYEAMACLDMEGEKKIIILAERGGSEVYPHGLIRWGVIDLKKYKLSFSDAGMRGMVVDVPGNWTNKKEKRDITDFYIDGNGFIWAAASEDHGDTGPFYSVVYQLGKVKEGDSGQPVQVFDKIVNFKEIPGVKIEALSGPCAGIESSHAFGTEDEIYGGIWRPIMIVGN